MTIIREFHKEVYDIWHWLKKSKMLKRWLINKKCNISYVVVCRFAVKRQQQMPRQEKHHQQQPFLFRYCWSEFQHPYWYRGLTWLPAIRACVRVSVRSLAKALTGGQYVCESVNRPLSSTTGPLRQLWILVPSSSSSLGPNSRIITLRADSVCRWWRPRCQTL